MNMVSRLLTIANEYGTPVYAYDLDALQEKINSLHSALHPSVKLFYAAKANTNIEILKWFHKKVDGLDISSGGEFRQAVLAGYDPMMFSFAGPGKTETELYRAISTGCGSISVESYDELMFILQICKINNYKANVLIRINSQKKINKFAIKMGGKPSAFGIDQDQVYSILHIIKENLSFINFKGFHIYSGTQCLDAQSLADYYQSTLELIEKIITDVEIAAPQIINLGGGMGVDYFGNEKLDEIETINGLNKSISEYENKIGTTKFILELGRYLMAPVGYYLISVLVQKQSFGKEFIILDGGMNHNLAAAGHLGQILKKNYLILNLSNPEGMHKTYNLSGPLCTPLDTLATQISLPEIKLGDVLAIQNSGAYGYTASPLLFLGHPTPKEVVFTKEETRLVRKSFNLEDFN